MLWGCLLEAERGFGSLRLAHPEPQGSAGLWQGPLQPQAPLRLLRVDSCADPRILSPCLPMPALYSCVPPDSLSPKTSQLLAYIEGPGQTGQATGSLQACPWKLQCLAMSSPHSADSQVDPPPAQMPGCAFPSISPAPQPSPDPARPSRMSPPWVFLLRQSVARPLQACPGSFSSPKHHPLDSCHGCCLSLRFPYSRSVCSRPMPLTSDMTPQLF